MQASDETTHFWYTQLIGCNLTTCTDKALHNSLVIYEILWQTNTNAFDAHSNIRFELSYFFYYTQEFINIILAHIKHLKHWRIK